jgi:predicted RNA-binding Zn ribbon-like protein
MAVGQQQFLAGRSARTAAQRAADLLAVLRVDQPDPESVSEVLRAHGERESLRLSADEVAELRQAADALYGVFAAADVQEAALRLNELLAAAHPPRLTTHGGNFDWHLHIDGDDDAPMGEWFLTASCLALAVLLAERQQLPGRICAAPGCGTAFVDLGGGSERRYCSSRCATRQRVAAHRRSRQ